jgi:Protein of unknown function (DUF4232)
MTDDNRDIRDMLDRKARDVQPRMDMPPELRGRVRRRIALNAVGAGAVVVVVGLALFAGIRTFGTSAKRVPIDHATTPPASTGPASPTACTSDQLSASVTLGGAAGQRVGPILVTNDSTEACTLQGHPSIQLLGDTGRVMTSGIEFIKTQAQWQADNSPQPEGWPVVTLQPGDAAAIRLSWGNWCSAQHETWQIQMPDGGYVSISGFGNGGPPPCNGPGQDSTIQLGPFEPASAPSSSPP